MNKETYTEQRASLLVETETLILEGKIEESNAKMVEIETLDNSWDEIKLANANMNALKDNSKVITLEDKSLEIKGEKQMEKMENVLEVGFDSDLYKNAWLKNLVGKELTQQENVAFTTTTANTTAPLPTTMLNEIWDLVSKAHAIMGDIKIYRTGTILEVVKHTAIAAGAAKVVAQGVANDDEENTFVKVTLSGKDFSKHVVLSYAMAAMSLDALEAYLIAEISANIGEALADDVVATIIAGTAAGNKTTSAAIKVTTHIELAKVFGSLKKVSAPVVYVNNSTFYNYIVSIVDTTGRPIFQPSLNAGAQGVLIGAQVKIEESVADNVILVGDPQKVVCNMVQDILIEQDKDIKTHTNIYAGYARAESALLNDTSFAVFTMKLA